MKVRVGDLWPGSHWNVDSKRFFPKLTWQHWEDTFRMLDQRPETPDEQWPVYDIWHEYLRSVFGRVPEPDEADPLVGRAWAWENLKARILEMHASFKANGYHPLLATGGESEVLVRIGGDGKICVVQGNKRVALCRTYEGDDFCVDVRILGVAKTWKESIDHLKKLSSGKTKLYQPIEHPVFAEWDVTQPCRERWDMIENAVKSTMGMYRGSVLDLGCHTGWFCRRFSENGFNNVVGVENQLPVVDMAKAMETWNVHNRTRVEYIYGDVFDLGKPPNADIVLCLSLLMHMFKEPEKAWRLLEQISERTQLMFVDCVWGGYAKRLPFTEQNMGSMIVGKTKFRSYELLGRTEHENRPFMVFR